MKYKSKKGNKIFGQEDDKESFPILGGGKDSTGPNIWETSKAKKKSISHQNRNNTRNYDFSRDFTSNHNTASYKQNEQSRRPKASNRALPSSNIDWDVRNDPTPNPSSNVILKTKKKKKKRGKKGKSKKGGNWVEAPGLLMGTRRQQMKQRQQEFPTLGGGGDSPKNNISTNREYQDPFAGSESVNYLEKSRRGKIGHYQFQKLDKKFSNQLGNRGEIQQNSGEVNYLQRTNKQKKEVPGVVMLQSKKKKGKKKRKGGGKAIRII